TRSSICYRDGTWARSWCACPASVLSPNSCGMSEGVAEPPDTGDRGGRTRPLYLLNASRPAMEPSRHGERTPAVGSGEPVARARCLAGPHARQHDFGGERRVAAGPKTATQAPVKLYRRAQLSQRILALVLSPTPSRCTNSWMATGNSPSEWG